MYIICTGFIVVYCSSHRYVLILPGVLFSVILGNGFVSTQSHAGVFNVIACVSFSFDLSDVIAGKPQQNHTIYADLCSIYLKDISLIQI